MKFLRAELREVTPTIPGRFRWPRALTTFIDFPIAAVLEVQGKESRHDSKPFGKAIV